MLARALACAAVAACCTAYVWRELNLLRDERAHNEQLRNVIALAPYARRAG